MYTKSSKYYDLIFAKADKNYLKESYQIYEIVKKLNPNAKTFLDIACGTGEHDKYLKTWYNVEGIDINDDFLEIAKNKNPDLKYYKKNIVDFNLNKKYDVIASLFSAIGLLKSKNELENTIKCLVNHINKKGILIIEPFIEPKYWDPEKYKLNLRVYEDKDIKYTRISKSFYENGKATAKEFHLYVDRIKEEYFEEYFEFSLFTREDIKIIFEKNNLNYSYIEYGLIGRGLHVGIKA